MSRKDRQHPAHPKATRKARLLMVLGGLSAVILCLCVRYYWGAESASAKPATRNSTARSTPAKPQRPAAKTDGQTPLKVVAAVNGEQITRQILGQECLRHYGEAVLESLSNKVLITQECKRRGIAITRNDVDAEIKRMAGRFNLATDQWLKMLKKEREISPVQYASDIIWPTLALRRLADEQLTVTQEELHEAFDIKYGPKIDARLIACQELSKAREAHAKAVADPDNFHKLAQEYSEDAPSASLGGRIQPICKHGTYAEIEQAAFSMKDGEISPVIHAGGQYVILQRRREIPPVQRVDFQRVAPQLEEIIRDGKSRSAAKKVFQRLQNASPPVNVLNDPRKQREMPGVAAVIGGYKITISQLAEQCIDRHGTEVLEGTINRRLIEQACKKRQVTVTEADMHQEIARAAALFVDPGPDGSADVDAWLKRVVDVQGISIDVYRHDEVWPSVALRKLVGQNAKVTEEDLRKAYEANYGSKVRCRAIVLNDLRRAQRVWEMASKNRTAEHFGTLAEEYSIEPGSSGLKGVVPPIKRHGGQPDLEKQAFSLKPGELSGIVQIGRRYVILWCDGYTTPTKVDFTAVRKDLYDDMYEKKLRVKMGQYFQHLQDTATVDNYLAGTTQRPRQSAVPKSTGPKSVASGPPRVSSRR